MRSCLPLLPTYLHFTNLRSCLISFPSSFHPSPGHSLVALSIPVQSEFGSGVFLSPPFTTHRVSSLRHHFSNPSRLSFAPFYLHKRLSRRCFLTRQLISAPRLPASIGFSNCTNPVVNRQLPPPRRQFDSLSDPPRWKQPFDCTTGLDSLNQHDSTNIAYVHSETTRNFGLLPLFLQLVPRIGSNVVQLLSQSSWAASRSLCDSITSRNPTTFCSPSSGPPSAGLTKQPGLRLRARLFQFRKSPYLGTIFSTARRATVLQSRDW